LWSGPRVLADRRAQLKEIRVKLVEEREYNNLSNVPDASTLWRQTKKLTFQWAKPQYSDANTMRWTGLGEEPVGFPEEEPVGFPEEDNECRGTSRRPEHNDSKLERGGREMRANAQTYRYRADRKAKKGDMLAIYGEKKGKIQVEQLAEILRLGGQKRKKSDRLA
jgi:hypothetical protein